MKEELELSIETATGDMKEELELSIETATAEMPESTCLESSEAESMPATEA